MSQVDELVGADDVDRAAAFGQAAPVAQCRNYHTRLGVVRHTCIAVEFAPVVEHADEFAMLDAARGCIGRVDEHVLFALTPHLVFFVGVLRIQEAVALGRDDI